MATNPTLISRVVGIVYRVIAAHLIKQAGYRQQSARTGAVTLIQRFGSALNLNVHFHMLFLDGVYERAPGRFFRTDLRTYRLLSGDQPDSRMP